MENNSKKDNRIHFKNWPRFTQLVKKLYKHYPNELSQDETQLIQAMDQTKYPSCNIDCDGFNQRKLPFDFDTRLIAYMTTCSDFSEADRALILNAVMRYAPDTEQNLVKLSVHVIQEFRKAIVKPYEGLEEKVGELNHKLDQLLDEIEIKTEYARSLLKEIAYLSHAMQEILQKSAGSVIQSETKVIDAFNKNAPNDEIIQLIKVQNRKFIQFLKEESKKATHDSLTGIYNRGMFDAQLTKTFADCSKNNTSLSLFMIDIDHFKKINDTYGHPVGDSAIQFVVNAIQERLNSDSIFFARYGGEEFVVLLKGYALKKAISIAESLRLHVAEKPFFIQKPSQSINITISIGVAQCSNKIASVDAFVEFADRALYEAKNTGRNKVRYITDDESNMKGSIHDTGCI